MIRTKELHIAMQDEMMNTVHRAENGEISMLDALIRLEENRKNLENTLAIAKSFKDDHFDEIQSESLDYPDGYQNHTIEIRNGGRTFNYKKIPEWQKHEKALKDCEAKHKQAFLSKEKGMMIASEYGEEMVMPEVVYRKSSIIVKPKK